MTKKKGQRNDQATHVTPEDIGPREQIRTKSIAVVLLLADLAQFAIVVVVHHYLESLIAWAVPDPLFHRAITGATALAFGVIYVNLLYEMVLVFVRFPRRRSK